MFLRHVLRVAAVSVPLVVAGPAAAAAGSWPPYAMPFHPERAPVPAMHPPTAPVQRLVYHGGGVISNVLVNQVNWGPSVWSKAVADMPGFFAFVGPSKYTAWWSSQYDTAGRLGTGSGGTGTSTNQHIGPGTFGTSTTITPSVVSGTIDDTQISAELSAQLTAGKLPAPVFDKGGYANSLYFIFFPPGMTITLQGLQSCVQGGFGGYHFTITYQGKEVPYAVIPDYSQDCGNQDEATMQFASSHELTEAVTDADVGSGNVAWNSDQDQGQEIGDLCASQPAAQLGSYIVQPEWSNYDDACVVESTYRLPICTAALAPPNCRLCNPADNGAGCAAPTPQCDVNPSSGSYGKCVACSDNSGCTAAAPICDTTTNTCRGCSSDADCKAPTPACATSASDPKHGSCVACTTSAHCAAPTPVCDTSSDTCVACDVDADCKSASAPRCTNHSCGPCIGSNCSGPSVDGGGGDDGGNGATPTGFTTTTTSCGCAIESQGGGLGALAFAAGLGLTAARRRRRSR